MKLKFNEFLAVVYGDIFDFPLKRSEARLWGIEAAAVSGLRNNSRWLQKLRVGDDSYIRLKGSRLRKNLREERKLISKNKMASAREVGRWLARIPTVEAIFITGSIAAKNARRNADIDLMIISKPATMWMTRLATVLPFKGKRLYRGRGNNNNKICTNIFLDRDHLGVKERNIFTAHEILLAWPVVDKSGITGLWLSKNSWVRNWLPVAYDRKVANTKSETPTTGKWWWLLLPVELTAWILQYLYMRSKITKEQVGWGRAYFHPRDLSVEVEKRFRHRLRGLGLMLR